MRLTTLLTCTALGLAASPALALDKVTYQLDWLPGGDKSPIYVCIQEGFCEEAGIEVSIEPGRGSSEAITKLGTGSSDIGSAGMGAVMAAVATEGVPVKIVMSIFNKGPHAFYTTTDKGITSIADMKGKTIATSPFTSSNVFLPLVLADNGLSEDDITLTKSDPATLGPLLMTGQADAIIAWLTDVSRYTGQGEEAGKEVVALPWSDAGLELYSAALVASDTFLAERPEVAARFVAAFRKSIEFAQGQPRGRRCRRFGHRAGTLGRRRDGLVAGCLEAGVQRGDRGRRSGHHQPVAPGRDMGACRRQPGAGPGVAGPRNHR